MNLALFALTMFSIGLILSESTYVRNWFDSVTSYFRPRMPTGLDFLIDIDHLIVTDEEVDAFTKYLLDEPLSEDTQSP